MKKKLFVLAILFMVVLYVPSVFAVGINGCNALIPNAVIEPRIANLVHTVILLIQIAVPIVLVIMGLIDLFKGITAQKEEEIKKGQQLLIKRIITAVIIFFVIAGVKLLISIVAGKDLGTKIIDCANCFFNGANETTGECNK